MSAATYEDLHLYTLQKTDDPGVLARRQMLAEWMLEASPETREKLVDEGKLQEARTAVREVLEARGMVLGPQEQARVDACTDLDILRRWHKRAIVAANAADAMR